MRAVIVGAGIGGLSAAVALRRVGIEALVIERAPGIREVGAGLSLWSNAVNALRALLIAFLLGFIPQYIKAREAQQLASACESRLGLARVQRLGALTYVSATQLNFGTASGYAQQFFDQAQKLAASTSDPAIQNATNVVLSVRDKVTAELAKGDAAVVGELQPLISKLEQTNP